MYSGINATTDRIDRIVDSRPDLVRIGAIGVAIGRAIDRSYRSHIARTDTSINPNESYTAIGEIDAIGNSASFLGLRTGAVDRSSTALFRLQRIRRTEHGCTVGTPEVNDALQGTMETYRSREALSSAAARATAATGRTMDFAPYFADPDTWAG